MTLTGLVLKGMQTTVDTSVSGGQCRPSTSSSGARVFLLEIGGSRASPSLTCCRLSFRRRRARFFKAVEPCEFPLVSSSMLATVVSSPSHCRCRTCEKRRRMTGSRTFLSPARFFPGPTTVAKSCSLLTVGAYMPRCSVVSCCMRLVPLCSFLLELERVPRTG